MVKCEDPSDVDLRWRSTLHYCSYPLLRYKSRQRRNVKLACKAYLRSLYERRERYDM